MTDIRSFRNGDLPALLEIWDQHWSAFGPPPHVNLARFEQAVVARTYFDPAKLLVAENEKGILGWCQYFRSRDSDRSAVIAALCSSLSCDRASFEQLLGEVIRRAGSEGFQELDAGIVRDNRFGYAGLDPVGHGVAIPLADMRAKAVLQQSGFQPSGTVQRLVAQTGAYRPPFNREALQLRRSTSVETADVVFEQPRDAAAMSHLDVQTRHLVQRNGDVLARLSVWMSDPEAEVMRPSQAILDIDQAHQRGALEGAEAYLIGAVVQALAVRRIETVETVVDSDKTELLAQLTSLQFRVVDEGRIWTRTLGEMPA